MLGNKSHARWEVPQGRLSLCFFDAASSSTARTAPLGSVPSATASSRVFPLQAMPKLGSRPSVQFCTSVTPTSCAAHPLLLRLAMIVAQQLVRSKRHKLSASHLSRVSDALRFPANSCPPSITSRFNRADSLRLADDRNYRSSHSQVPCFETITNSLALSKTLTPLQSGKSELLRKNTRVGDAVLISPFATSHSPLYLSPLSTAFTYCNRVWGASPLKPRSLSAPVPVNSGPHACVLKPGTGAE